MNRMLRSLLVGVLVVAGSLSGASGAASTDLTQGSFVLEQAPVRWHMQSGRPHFSVVGGGAVAFLARTQSGLSYWITTNQLQPGHAVTVWLVVINNPAACAADPCSPSDILLNPATNSQVTYGTGAVVGRFGAAMLFGAQARGPIPAGWLAGRGLDDPLGAEVHFVLNDHGPVLPEFMPAMIQTYRAGCTDASLPAIFPPSAKADGPAGPNTCRLWQLAVFA